MFIIVVDIINGDKFDVVITYSLDNYIQIQGYVKGDDGNKKTVNKSGYVLDNSLTKNLDNTYSYKGGSIDNETSLEEKICYIDTEGITRNQTLPCRKIEGTKYYVKEDGKTVFSVLNGREVTQNGIDRDTIKNNDNAVKYYKEAWELKEFINKYLSDLTTDNIKNIDGYEYYNISGTKKIFDWDNIEKKDSNFNIHRIDVIKNSIERNLSIVINNFNNYSGVTTDFQMPKLKDDEWDKIMDNISIISFLQGVSIGGKVYNGYSIITNTKNNDVVMPDSIYIKTGDNVFHRVTEEGLQTKPNLEGIFNVNLERRSLKNDEGTMIYYFPSYPSGATLSYDSIVTQDKVDGRSINDYLESVKEDNNYKNLRKVYYTALARERYGLYRRKLEI